ncbi:hypothetical protein [Streptomyces sp. NPDC050759]|uniref:hypothetical protein n=1 Tax=Streptomyces sp. NPDC050759 TaxID=3365635 RepID=UPI0037A96135
MVSIWRKTAMVALASASLVGLAMSGTAQAARGYPSVHMQVCNATDKGRWYFIDGLNQNNYQVTYTGPYIEPGKCDTGWWWWKIGEKVTVRTEPPWWQTPKTSGDYYIPANAMNESTQTFTVRA